MIPLEAGVRIGGRFELLEPIGDGGHAEVWAAWDETRDQRVALKFLHPEICNVDDALLVLRHEAQMARRLAHSGVLRTEEPVQDGKRVFLPMEYAAGGDLKRLRGLSYLESVPVLIRVAEILAHAHELGIVHRDIKPGNVLFDIEGKVRLADFGTSALSGSKQTLAPGSPFSASPQQLMGEPASPADDIYGLGALAYELLGGYPPYFPDPAPSGMLDHMPPLVRPAVPAPPRLIRLVMTMLARDPAERPRDMPAVISELEEALADTLSLVPEGTAMIAERALQLDNTVLRPQVSRRKKSRWILLLAVAGLGALGYFAFQRGVLDAVMSPVRVVITPPASAPGPVAQAAPETPPVEVQEPATAAPADAGDEGFSKEIAAGELALSRGQSALARMAFERAKQARPDAPEVTQGLEATDRLDRVLALHTQGVQAEAAGQFALARERFAAALAIDASFGPAIEGRDRVAARLDERQRAAAARARDVERSEFNARDLRIGLELETAERWRDAQTLYQAARERDPTATFAQEGFDRAQRRAELSSLLDSYINRPARLSDRDVRRAAEQAVVMGQRVQSPGPALTAQLSRLSALLAAQATPARVEITSDSNTLVRIARVGELGRFMSRELDLPPGTYAVTGTREGYRDVRIDLVIAPGQGSAHLTVACNEPI